MFSINEGLSSINPIFWLSFSQLIKVAAYVYSVKICSHAFCFCVRQIYILFEILRLFLYKFVTNLLTKTQNDIRNMP